MTEPKPIVHLIRFKCGHSESFRNLPKFVDLVSLRERASRCLCEKCARALIHPEDERTR